MTLDGVASHNDFLERRKERERRPSPKRYRFNWPKSHEGDILAHTWVGTIHNPCKWLANNAEQEGFNPRKTPWTMSPAEQQANIAKVLCPPSQWGEYGCAVNFEQDPYTLYTSCVVALYSTNLLNFWTVKYQYFRGAHYYALEKSVDELHQKLITGEAGRNVILPPLYVGLPLGDNLEFRVMEE